MIELTLNETRVLGVLFEKERTTPDQYPLSLNALTNGCNQKSSRDPVLSLEEGDVQETVDRLIKKGLVAEVVVGSRVRKYRQRFGNTEFSEFKFSLKEQSILSVLFLRGPQTPGELRTRTNRLCEFSDVNEVEQVLQELINRVGNAVVTKLPREPGKRESRYMHLFSGEINTTMVDVTGVNKEPNKELTSISEFQRSLAIDDPDKCKVCNDRIDALEQQVETMQGEIDELKSVWNDLNS